MRTVLLTYEFGAGLGHLNRLIAVAQRLEGCRLVFALPDLGLGVPLVRRTFGDAAEIVQGVVWSAPNDPASRQVPTHTFADVIALFGFAEMARLETLTGRAAALLDAVKPDLVVSDFAPTLRLASAGRVPTVVVGNGYTIPPGGRLLPPMRPWETAVGAASRAQEGRLLAAVNAVRARRQGMAVDFFADLFQGEHSFPCTIAEFDPYGGVRSEPVVWPFNVPVIPEGPPVAERRGPAAFCYFQGNHPALAPTLAAAGSVGARTEVYVQGLDPQALAARCARNVGVHRKPADFAVALPGTRVLVHHAGLGTAYAGVLAGTPQLVIPHNLEHAITARGLERFGSAVRLGVSPPPEAGTVGRVLRGMLGDADLQARAGRAARDLAARRVPDPVGPIAAACTGFL